MSAAVSRIRNAVVEALSPHDRVLLAVSGGVDSMVMLDAAREAKPRVIVATFDHRTGRASGEAARLVDRRCRELGLKCIRGRARTRFTGEEAWREQRWGFLRRIAREESASIATAHTLDDQVETVFMRILRDAGPRGIAGLYARSEILRPLLGARRTEIEAYARKRAIEYVDDPSNLSRRHLRNRVRLDLLPAFTAARPSFPAELLDMAERAADWRDTVAAIVDALGVERHSDGSLFVARSAIGAYDEPELAILWPEIAARTAVTMDRRGTHRVAAFTKQGATGGAIQLSGGIEVVRTREHFVVRRRTG